MANITSEASSVPALFSPLTLRGITFRNRIAVAPMCQYSSEDGFANDWHFVHLGSHAVGGAGLIITEAAAVEARGRISPQDLGIYKDVHIEPLRRITRFLREHGAVPGMQIAHAGRKASTRRPWEHKRGVPALVPESEGGWTPVAPSPIAFAHDYGVPEELTEAQIGEVIRDFGAAARRAREAGFQVIEIHAAHGYLLHEFLSPLSNQRTDRYGGSFENRARIVREVVEEVRRHWPEELPLLLRISATDWAPEGGWDVAQSVELARLLPALGVDLVDCSSGGLIPGVSIPVGPGYQVEFAERIRREAGVPTGAVGLITEAQQAEDILLKAQADLILLARAMLRDPYWPAHAAKEMGHKITAPPQYERAW